MDAVTPPGSPAEAPGPVGTPPIPRRRGRKLGAEISARSKGIPGQAKQQAQIAMMVAADCSVGAIVRGLKLSRDRVNGILGQADTAGLVDDFRKIVRAHALSQSLDIAVKGMAWVNEAIDEREAKTFDLVTRGLSNMEKVWSSASGENASKGVQVAVINNQAPGEVSAETARLIELMLAGPKP